MKNLKIHPPSNFYAETDVKPSLTRASLVTTPLKTQMKRLLLLALTTGTLLMGTAAYAQCCCSGQMNGQTGTTPQEGVKK